MPENFLVRNVFFPPRNFLSLQPQNCLEKFPRKKQSYGVRRPKNFFDPPETFFSAPKTFFPPPKLFSAPQIIFGRSQRITQPDIWAPALGSQLMVTAHFRLPTHVILVLVRVSSNRLGRVTNPRLFFFSAFRKTAVYRRPKPKIGFFGGAYGEKAYVRRKFLVTNNNIWTAHKQ